MVIELPMVCIFSAKPVDKSKLLRVDRELTDEDVDFYSSHGWQSFDPEAALTDYFLPDLGTRIESNKDGAVVPIKGRKYKVEILYRYDCAEVWEADGKLLRLTETDEPLTQHQHGIYKFFGQPRWIQSRHYPADLLGNPCYHLLTVDNGWGDSGNWNILIGFDENDIPNVAYFEASCC